MAFAIVTDSTCDLPSNIVKERGITVTPEHILWGTESFMDGVDMMPEALYTRLAHDPVLPKTSQPSPGEFADHYRRARESQHADAVLWVTLGKLLSGTYASAEGARNLVDFPVTVVDSTTVTT